MPGILRLLTGATPPNSKLNDKLQVFDLLTYREAMEYESVVPLVLFASIGSLSRTNHWQKGIAAASPVFERIWQRKRLHPETVIGQVPITAPIGGKPPVNLLSRTKNLPALPSQTVRGQLASCLAQVKEGS